MLITIVGGPFRQGIPKVHPVLKEEVQFTKEGKNQANQACLTRFAGGPKPFGTTSESWERSKKQRGKRKSSSNWGGYKAVFFSAVKTPQKPKKRGGGKNLGGEKTVMVKASRWESDQHGEKTRTKCRLFEGGR